MTASEKFERVHALLGQIRDIPERPAKYMSMDTITNNVDEISRILDDVEFEVKDYVETRYSSPNEMLILHEEHHQAIREAVQV